MIEKHYMLITKGSCGYCRKAIELLEESNLSFAHTDMANAEKLLDLTKEQVNWTTVPIIWEQVLQWENGQPTVVGNSFVGGYTELSETLGYTELSESEGETEEND